MNLIKLIIYDFRKEKRYDWTKFRMLSRLDKKYDESLTEYFRAFMAMCKRQCGIRLSEGENESKFILIINIMFFLLFFELIINALRCHFHQVLT